MDDVFFQIGFDGLQQLNADEDEQEKSEDVEQLFNFENQQRRRQNILDEGPAGLNHGKQNHNRHHDGQTDGDNPFKGLDPFQHMFSLSGRLGAPLRTGCRHPGSFADAFFRQRKYAFSTYSCSMRCVEKNDPFRAMQFRMMH